MTFEVKGLPCPECEHMRYTQVVENGRNHEILIEESVEAFRPGDFSQATCACLRHAEHDTNNKVSNVVGRGMSMMMDALAVDVGVPCYVRRIFGSVALRIAAFMLVESGATEGHARELFEQALKAATKAVGPNTTREKPDAGHGRHKIMPSITTRGGSA